MRYFVWTIIVIVAAAVIAGFFVVGSPAEERLRQFDAQRVNALQILQSEIVYYWQNKERLPVKLSDLTDPLRGFQVPADPQTGEEYGYAIKGPLTFSLCATFVSPSAGEQTNRNFAVPKSAFPAPSEPYSGFTNSNWEHSAGYTCFDRTIDKDFYKPIKQR